MKLIQNKKQLIPVSSSLHEYLLATDRTVKLPISYDDLLRYDNAVALYDRDGQDTLWTSVGYSASERNEMHKALVEIYAIMKSEGDMSVMDHLVVDRVDLCMYGNTKPFRIRIINTLNENFDYFYVKTPDASRIYGLELEDILSPNRIGFLVDDRSLIEEHIYGIPGDIFIQKYMDHRLNEVRLAKEFVKFNERCFLRLLGDMHASNFVVDITVDFEENMYRIRAIDFDQQSFEGRKHVYLPQYFKENNAIIALGMKHLTWESVRQYQREERALMNKRAHAERYRLGKLLDVMENETLAPEKNTNELAHSLAEHYDDPKFAHVKTMGGLVRRSLSALGKTLG